MNKKTTVSFWDYCRFFQLLTLLLTLFDFPRNKNNHAAHKPRGYRILYGGDKDDRTPDLLHAMQALSQLSYTPMCLVRKIL